MQTDTSFHPSFTAPSPSPAPRSSRRLVAPGCGALAVVVAVVVTIIVMGGRTAPVQVSRAAAQQPAPAATPAAPSAPVQPAQQPAVQVAAGSTPIGRTIHYAGFTVTLDSVSSDSAKGVVTVATTFHNDEGDATNASDSINAVSLAAGGVTYTGQVTSTSTPGGGSSKGTIEFDGVAMPFTPSGATMTFGDSFHQQAFVGLGTMGIVDLAPIAFPVPSQPTSFGSLTYSLQSAEISAQVPGDHIQVGADHLVLRLGFSVTRAAGSDAPGYTVASLLLPNGTAVPATVDGAAEHSTDSTEHLCSEDGCIDTPDAGTTTSGQWLRYTVPTEPGKYTLQIGAPGSENAPATIQFTVPAFHTNV